MGTLLGAISNYNAETPQKFISGWFWPEHCLVARITCGGARSEAEMALRFGLISIAALLAGVGAVAPAQALTMKECSAKYKAAESAGTLNGLKWNDFRKAQCGPAASAVQDQAKAATPPFIPQAAPGNAVFPTAISPKYSSEAAGRARMHTCVDQYNANKAANQNGGLKWIEKGGGYYSECNKRLKG